MKTIAGRPLPEAVLLAAIPTFIDSGYDNTSMDVIAARAGTTKRTVYAHFGSKEQLFRATVAKAVDLAHAMLPPLSTASNPTEELEAFAARFCELCTWDRSVRLQRLVIGTAERFPDLSRRLHLDVIERTEKMVARYLLSVVTLKHPGMRARSLDWALPLASLFLEMTTGAQRYAALLQAEEPLVGPPGAEISSEVDRVRISRAVNLFLTGFYAELATWSAEEA